MRSIGHFIGGREVKGTSGRTADVFQPMTGEVQAKVDLASKAEVRAAATPKKKADRPRGEWNTFEITLKGDRLWVKLNGEEVISNAELPGVPPEGPIALQHHGSYNAKTGQWTGPPSLVQFRNIAIKELK